MNRAGELLFGTEAITWIQTLIGLGHPLPFRAFSLIGDTWGMMLVIGVAGWLYGRDARHAVIGMVAAGAVTKVVLSLLFSQSRPTGPDIVVYEQLEWSSFPSGHVYETVGPWGLLWALGCVPLWVPVGLAALVGIGRLYLGVHYLGDVLGGILFALPLVWAYARAWPAIRRWLGRRSAGLLRTSALALVAAAAAYALVAPPSPRRFEIIGMVIGGTLGLLLEGRQPPRAGAGSGRRRVATVALGLAGLGALLLADRSAPADSLWPGTVAAALGMLWVLVGVPLFARREAALPEEEGAAAR